MEEVTVKTLTGKPVRLQLPKPCSQTTVYEIKEMMQYSQGLPPDSQRLMHAGRLMSSNEATLDTYNVRSGSILHLVLQLRMASVFFSVPSALHSASDAVQAYEQFLEKEWPALLSSTSTQPDHGIHMWHEPTVKTHSFTALIEGPPHSPFEGGKFVVSVGVGSRVPQMRVLTPVHHPTIATNGQVTFLTDKAFFTPSPWPSSTAVLQALQTLRSQLLMNTFSSHQIEGISGNHLAKARLTEWKEQTKQAERKARVMTLLFAMTPREQATRWTGDFIAYSPELRQEVKSLLMAAARDPASGEPRYESAFLVSRLPREILEHIVRMLVLRHFPDEQRKLKEKLASECANSALPFQYFISDDWRERILRW